LPVTRSLSSIVFDPAARAEMGRILMPAVAICRDILDRRSDILGVLCSRGKLISYLSMNQNLSWPFSKSAPKVREVYEECQRTLPKTELSDIGLTLHVQRSLVALSSYEAPAVPVVAERTDIDDAGIHTPVRAAIRTIGARLSDGASVLVCTPEVVKHLVSAHERLSLERFRSTMTAEHLSAVDEIADGCLLRVRRIGDAVRLEHSPDGRIVHTRRSYLAPLPLE